MRYVYNQTVKGASHTDAGKECQDASLSWTNEDLAIIVVSDGHSGEKHSNSAIGAALACQTALNHLREFCNNIKDEWLNNKPDETIKRLCTSILAEWIHEISQLGDDCDVISYGCTLIAYVQAKDYWFALQIGDGRCAMLNRADEWNQPIPWDDRCILNYSKTVSKDDMSIAFVFNDT